MTWIRDSAHLSKLTEFCRKNREWTLISANKNIKKKKPCRKLENPLTGCRMCQNGLTRFKSVWNNLTEAGRERKLFTEPRKWAESVRLNAKEALPKPSAVGYKVVSHSGDRLTLLVHPHMHTWVQRQSWRWPQDGGYQVSYLWNDITRKQRKPVVVW